MSERRFLTAIDVSDLTGQLGDDPLGRKVEGSIIRSVEQRYISLEEDSLLDPVVLDFIFYPLEDESEEINDLYFELSVRASAYLNALNDLENEEPLLSPEEEDNFLLLVRAYFNGLYEDDPLQKAEIGENINSLMRGFSLNVCEAYERFIGYYENA